jgi:heat shock protein beta
MLLLQVIYLTEAIDEYLTQNLTEYEDKKFQNASKDDLKIGSKDEKTKFKEESHTRNLPSGGRTCLLMNMSNL